MINVAIIGFGYWGSSLARNFEEAVTSSKRPSVATGDR